MLRSILRQGSKIRFLNVRCVLIKFATYVRSHRIFDEVLTMMAEDWNDCAKSDIEMNEAVIKAKISNRIANAVMTLHTVVPLLYGVGVILANVDATNRTIELPHIYKVEVPFSINTQCTYKIVLIVELIHLVMCSWALGILNALLLILVSYKNICN